ncbi:hypothetical protein EVJ58_g3874 [Rhodofomes roseus]|nr:hypothetical protein EVJ58_g3874 [Rhodofomes roseus]
MTLQFTGTSIWVYCILTNSGAPYVTIATNASFELDGSQVGIYSHLPDSTAQQYEYNVTVFSMTGLNNVGHTLVINATQGSQASLILFDWAMYM